MRCYECWPIALVVGCVAATLSYTSGGYSLPFLALRRLCKCIEAPRAPGGTQATALVEVIVELETLLNNHNVETVCER